MVLRQYALVESNVHSCHQIWQLNVEEFRLRPVVLIVCVAAGHIEIWSLWQMKGKYFYILIRSEKTKTHVIKYFVDKWCMRNMIGNAQTIFGHTDRFINYYRIISFYEYWCKLKWYLIGSKNILHETLKENRFIFVFLITMKQFISILLRITSLNILLYFTVLST